MRWVRSRVRLGAWSALLGLTIQLALSFGHVHFDRAAPRRLSAPLVLQWVILLPPTVLDSPAAPSHGNSDSLAHDFCGICSVAGAAGLAAAVPILLVPIEQNGIFFNASPEFAIAVLPQHSFQARAPPYV
jgi:hypothetical protein